MTNNLFFFTMTLLGAIIGGCVSKKGKVNLSYSKTEIHNYESLRNDKFFTDSFVVRLLTGFSDETIRVKTEKGRGIVYEHVNTNMSIAYAKTLIIPSDHSMAKNLFLTIRNIEYTIPINYKYRYCDVSIDSANVLNVDYNNDILQLSKSRS